MHIFSSETPGAPRGPLVAKNEGRDAVALSWQPPLDDGGSPISSYIVDKLDVQRGGWVRAARIPAEVTSHVLGGLIPGHDYNFRVYAENRAGVGQPLDLKTIIKAKSPYSMFSKLEVMYSIEIFSCMVTYALKMIIIICIAYALIFVWLKLKLHLLTVKVVF